MKIKVATFLVDQTMIGADEVINVLRKTGCIVSIDVIEEKKQIFLPGSKNQEKKPPKVYIKLKGDSVKIEEAEAAFKEWHKRQNIGVVTDGNK